MAEDRVPYRGRKPGTMERAPLQAFDSDTDIDSDSDFGRGDGQGHGYVAEVC